MKKLIDRLKASSRAAPLSPAEADSAYISTMFTDRGDEDELPPELATWAQRAAEVQAEPVERPRGTSLFMVLWQQERQTVPLDDDELRRLAAYLQFVRIPAGQEVIGQDEQGDYMIIVLEGMLSVDRIQPWGGRARLAEARPGEMLGEMSLLDAGARFSACTTLTPCVVGVLDAQRLAQLIHHEPKLALATLASLSRRLSLRLRQVSARLSALLSRS